MARPPAHPDFEGARSTLLSARDILPTAEEVNELEEVLQGARDRGHFTPAEEASIRFLLNRYLHVRAALHSTLQNMKPFVPRIRTPKEDTAIKAFLCAWLSGCMLMRAARYLSTWYGDDPLVSKLLNQSDPICGFQARTFDEIRASATHPQTIARYLQALRFAEILQPKFDALAEDPDWSPLVQALREEQPFLEHQKRAHAKELARVRIDRWQKRPIRQYRRMMFGLFEASGRAIANMQNPFHRKRVRANTRKRAQEMMQPGDILITRHDDALSNVFLPGFWPHAAFVIGSREERDDLGVNTTPDRWERSASPIRIVEAKKDGVRFRSVRETLTVDSFMLLRPNYASEAERKEAVERALSHEGKLYDFEFDFTRSDRLVCTEVVYRSLQDLGSFSFDLLQKAGRLTLPAEDLLRQALANHQVEVLLLAGVKGNAILSGQRAAELIERSLRKPE